MSQAVNLDVFYPYSPERVWQVLTDRRALAAWSGYGRLLTIETVFAAIAL